MTKWNVRALQFAALGLLIGLGGMATTGKAEAVVYCKTVGYPKGCVARVGRPVVVAPAPVVVVRPPVRVYCTRPGYPRGCVVR